MATKKKAVPKKPVKGKKLPPKGKKDLSGLNGTSGTAGGYTESPAEPFAGEETPAEEALEHEELSGEGPKKCPACEDFITADPSMRFCPHCGMGLVAEAKALDEDDLITKDEEIEPEEEIPMKSKKKALVRKGDGKGVEDEPVERDMDDSDEEMPKHSAQVLAHLHNHVQNALDYIDQEHGKMDHNDIADSLSGHKDELEKHKQTYKDLMEEHHPDNNIEEMSKAIGGGGESQAVEQEAGDEEETPAEPPESEEADVEEVASEDQLPGGDVEDEPVKRGMKGEEGEDVSETPTDEILERYRQPKSLLVRTTKSGKRYSVKFKDGGKVACKDRRQADAVMKGVVKVCKASKCSKGHFEVVRDAGQHMYDLATQAKDIPSYHRAGLMHHSDGLGDICKELEGLEDEVEQVESEDQLPGEDVEDTPVERDVEDGDEGGMVAKDEPLDDEDKALIKSLHDRMNGSRNLLFRNTGKKLA